MDVPQLYLFILQFCYVVGEDGDEKIKQQNHSDNHVNALQQWDQYLGWEFRIGRKIGISGWIFRSDAIRKLLVLFHKCFPKEIPDPTAKELVD